MQELFSEPNLALGGIVSLVTLIFWLTKPGKPKRTPGNELKVRLVLE
jgi:hypothetical protein